MRLVALYVLVALTFCLTVSAQTTANVRLVSNTGSQTSGRLEVNYGNQWFSVCDTGSQIANLGNWVCGQLGLGTLKSTGNFGQAAAPQTAISVLTCAPTATLAQCSRPNGVDATCQQGGLTCSAQQCVVTDFGAWSACSVSCGGGTQQQSRTVSVAPTEGLTCPPLLNTQPCNSLPCPADCVMTDWSAWGNCSRLCDGGVQKRTRAVVTAAANGGAACSVETDQYQACNNQQCGQPCQVGDWGIWSDCDQSCNTGSMFRVRVVLSAPTPGGTPCPSTNVTVPCNTVPCPIDCLTSDWSVWGICSKDCGNGTRLQTRYVTNQPASGGSPCPSLTNQEECNTQDCPIDCTMTDWTAWTDCTQTCGTGAMTRTRTITAPPANGGLPCGDLTDTNPCNTARCPEDRAAILVDRIRKLELQDRINTLEELQVKQAAQLAATQTADLLSQIGGAAAAATSTGAAAATTTTTFLEELSQIWAKHQQEVDQHLSNGGQLDSRLRVQRQQMNALKASIDAARSDFKSLTVDPSPTDADSTTDSATVAAVSAAASDSDDEDEVVDEVDAQGHHHKRHHHHKKHNGDSKFSQAAPASGQPPLENVPPLFGHTISIPAGNNND